MGAVAERLSARQAAGAPEVGFVGFDLDTDGDCRGDLTPGYWQLLFEVFEPVLKLS